MGLAGSFVGYGAVEIGGGELSGFVPIAIEQCLAYLGQEVGRLFVLCPIVGRPLGGVGAAAPQCFFVERIAFGGDASHDVAAYAAITQRQGTGFPLGVGVPVEASGCHGLLFALLIGGHTLPPTGSPFEGGGLVEPHHVL